jgi:hypothetical protein
METNLEVYKLFRDREMAESVGEILKDAGIPYEITESKRYFDPSFAFNRVDPEINLKLMPQDFVKANHALKMHYERKATEADRDHYLFSFSDTELIEIVRKQDEWGSFDVALAKRILHERGIEISHEAEVVVEEERLGMLRKPVKAPATMVAAGYITAILGGFFGMLFGWLLCAGKILPNGEKVPVYTDADRRHGQRIMLIGLIFFLLFMGNMLVRSFIA